MRMPTRTSDKLANHEILKGHAEAIRLLEAKDRNGSATHADYSAAVSLLKKSHVLIKALLIDNRQL